MDRSERDRANRLYYINGGRCPTCGGLRPVEPGKTFCEVCGESQRKRKREIRNWRVENGLCARCGVPLEDDTYKTCQKCRDKQATYPKGITTYYQRKQKGMCVSCGENAATAGHTLCKKCLLQRRIANKMRDPDGAKKREVRAQRIAAGLCIDCNSPVDGNHTRCKRCRAARNDSNRKYRIHQKTLEVQGWVQ